jgi:cation:H+ antiporter
MLSSDIISAHTSGETMRYIILIGIVILITIDLTLTLGLKASVLMPYWFIILCLVIGLLTILGGCEVFANGVECLGSRLNLSHATVGSLLAAVGTALPETSVPILALLFGKEGSKEDIAIGAILGAPFMLSTLAMFMLGFTVIIDRVLGRRKMAVANVNFNALRFELSYFIPIMGVLLIVSLIDIEWMRHVVAFGLLITYIVFFIVSLGHEQLEDEEYTDLFYLSRLIGCPVRIRWILLQVLIGLGLIVIGAHIFVEYLTNLSIKSGISPLILSLILTPVATELPEKFNSITWTLKGRDTIGLSNITGAMVFQSTIPVSVGLLFTRWSLSYLEMVNIVSTILMGILIFSYVTLKKRLPGWLLLAGGLFYLFYIMLVVSMFY